MRISKLLSSGKAAVSCGVFPPKKAADLEQVQGVARQITAFKPSFPRVAYGADGKKANRGFLIGAAPPPRFRAIVDKFSDKPEAMKQAGIAYATEQIIDLISNGINAIRLYTMNKPKIAGKIMENLSEIID